MEQQFYWRRRTAKCASLAMVGVCLFKFSTWAQMGNEAWLHGEAREILTHALTVTSNQPYLSGQKTRLQNDPQNGFAYYQRWVDGQMERKRVSLHAGEPQTTTWDLPGGRYYLDSAGLLFKLGYDEDFETEARLAQTIERPHEYRMLEPTMVGTNACVVVRRSMTSALLNAVARELYANKTETDRNTLTPKYVRAIRDFYIRKSDGLIMGELRRNVKGDLLRDLLCEEISTQAIPAKVFAVPRMAEAKYAATFDAFTEMSRMNKERLAGTTRAQTAGRRWTRWLVLGVLTFCAFVVPFFWLRTAQKQNKT